MFLESHKTTPSDEDVRTPEPEEALLERARSGDEKAFSEIVRRYEQMVYNFSYKICRDRRYAEETLQDTFVNVFRKLKQFDGKSKFSTWLYSIVANNCLMKRRKGKLEAASVSIDDDANGDHHDIQSWRNTPLEATMSKELRERLDEAIRKLPVDYRLAFILRDIEGKSAEETSKILKISVPAVKSRLRRARVFLRGELNEYMAA